MKESSTHKRRTKAYPTPQNEIRLKKATTNPDGTKKDGISKNKIINEALNMFFATHPNYCG